MNCFYCHAPAILRARYTGPSDEQDTDWLPMCSKHMAVTVSNVPSFSADCGLELQPIPKKELK